MTTMQFISFTVPSSSYPRNHITGPNPEFYNSLYSPYCTSKSQHTKLTWCLSIAGLMFLQEP